ncbi:phytoene desaturase family protein [Leptospira idonii]|uniref:NAD(P)/FAD-dependent oxidoreductase n=1 Tax=Leptospira idonii TaxID=1193500 RepID=A0A4R9LY31_9LEPT|nr:NAD(P)/FAD-dependent oxidoreductase [Leptospira idonii]TGN19213.1 NAD(P)/FAD-dependent oxidoreductase [Leptospira idonii]
MTRTKDRYDVCIIGSGPNGLSAASLLAQSGLSILVLEAKSKLGGGMRTEELTLPGFLHDVCSGAHPMGILSPFFKTLPLEKFGLKWKEPPISVAHPLDEEPSVLLTQSIEETAEGLGIDGSSYQKLISPFVNNSPHFWEDVLAPIHIPKDPFSFVRFGLTGIRSAKGLAGSRFKEKRAKALFAGLASHSILPLESPLTAALGLVFAVSAHQKSWPVVEGGSENLAKALVAYLNTMGVEFQTNTRITSIAELPQTKVVIFDTDPLQLASLTESHLPGLYRKRLERFRFGPGVFKMDWALDRAIPWKDPKCLSASTIHLGGTMEEIAKAEADVWKGKHPDRPYVLLVQQSLFDPSRAPNGKHTGYAYCHVPNGSRIDLTEVIEKQIERFAPGFSKTILARHSMYTADFERYNPNYVGGAITGGAADLTQAFFRPVARLNPYSTPNPHLYICSASTPPGGGVHGMCGFYAAKTVLKRIDKLKSLKFT